MVRTLLTERFKLQEHRESRELPIYYLVMDRAEDNPTVTRLCVMTSQFDVGIMCGGIERFPVYLRGLAQTHGIVRRAIPGSGA